MPAQKPGRAAGAVPPGSLRMQQDRWFFSLRTGIPGLFSERIKSFDPVIGKGDASPVFLPARRTPFVLPAKFNKKITR
jgi:hypothetical protein